jgi:hypothetical protein
MGTCSFRLLGRRITSHRFPVIDPSPHGHLGKDRTYPISVDETAPPKGSSKSFQLNPITLTLLVN